MLFPIPLPISAVPPIHLSQLNSISFLLEYQLQCRPTQDTATLGKIVKINKKYEEKMDLQHVMVDGDMIMMEEEVILMRQKPKKEKKPKKKEKNSVGGKNSSKKSRAKREIKQANIWPDKTKIPYDFDTSSIAAYSKLSIFAIHVDVFF